MRPRTHAHTDSPGPICCRDRTHPQNKFLGMDPEKGHKEFGWQSGYGVFSVSESLISGANKVHRNAGGTPSEAFISGGIRGAFLKKNNVAYDGRVHLGLIFRPCRACLCFRKRTQGLRPGLHSCVASRSPRTTSTAAKEKRHGRSRAFEKSVLIRVNPWLRS